MSEVAVFMTSAFLCSGALYADDHEEGADPAEMFEKMDLNGDRTVDHDEFLEFNADADADAGLWGSGA